MTDDCPECGYVTDWCRCCPVLGTPHPDRSTRCPECD
jgi:hypothetical protein